MPALGGAPRKVAAAPADYPLLPQWSRDGSELAFVVGQGTEATLTILELGTRERRTVTLSGNQRTRFDLAWSPDGNRVAYVDASSVYNDSTRLLVTRISDGSSHVLATGSAKNWSPNWSPDGRTLFYVSSQGGTMDLWQQKVAEDGSPEGSPRPATSGLVLRRASLSPDGTKLAYSKGRRVGNVWRIPLPDDRPATWDDAVQLTFDEAMTEYMSVAPDGRQLATSSDRGGNPDLWKLDLASNEWTQLTTHPAGDYLPDWSPNMTELAFYSTRSDNYDAWILPLDGGPARQITDHELWDFAPVWSPDARRLAIQSNRTGTFHIWTIDVATGTLQRITDGEGGSSPNWSPDGKWIVFNVARGARSERGLWRVPAAGGEGEQLTQGADSRPRWSNDGTRIVFKRRGLNANDLWALSLADKSERVLTDLGERRGNLFGFDIHGRDLYFSWEENLGDIWIMDVVTDESE